MISILVFSNAISFQYILLAITMDNLRY